MRLKKKFGQHFLKNENDAKRVADAVSMWGNQYPILLEIGPGGGALTQFLASEMSGARKLKLIEVDTDLIDNLKSKFGAKGVEVEHVDFLKADLDSIETDFGVAGNFPYNISSQILFKVLDFKHKVPEVVGMFQKEVSQRVAAPHGSKTYGILSVLVQSYYKVETVFTLKPGAFNPPPKVDSQVIRLERYRTEIEGLNHMFFHKLVKAAFGQRRKTLRNSIKMFLGERKNDDTLDAILRLRPEQLSVEAFIDLTKKLQ
ncbi:MAG: ribosomal RNA small subunit methyltransferase A [Bacteroidia bacterium]